MDEMLIMSYDNFLNDQYTYNMAGAEGQTITNENLLL